jgi:hypothetical protein
MSVETSRKSRKTACAIAAHLRFASVAVVITHAEIAAILRRLDHEQSVRANAAMPIANPRNRRAIEAQGAGAIVEDDKIVARAIHLREMHDRSHITSRPIRRTA